MALIDNYGKDCKACGRGQYVETGFFDDMDGIIHCNACGDWIKRHYEMTDKEKLEIVIGVMKKIIGPYTYEDDINCLDDAMILIRQALDTIGETW